MNSKKQLRLFLEKAALEKKVMPSHMAVYLTLFQLWSDNDYKNPFSINRKEIMKHSKIKSIATYHKCLKSLNDLQFIKYQPTFHPYKGSQVLVVNLTTLNTITSH